jgi:hypothetical protein
MGRQVQIDRYWDVLYTDDQGFTDYAEYFLALQKYRAQRLMAGARAFVIVKQDPVYTNKLIPASQAISLELDGQIANSDDSKVGYVASTVTKTELNSQNKNATTQKLISWINNEKFAGKLRFTSHGLEDGTLAPNSKDPIPRIAGGAVAEWLLRNGLKQTGQLRSLPKGLVMIAINACMSARYLCFPAYKVDPTATSWSVYKDATIYQIHDVLVRAPGIYGVYITGTNEVIMRDGRYLTRAVGMPTGDGWGKINEVQKTDKKVGEQNIKVFDYSVEVPNASNQGKDLYAHYDFQPTLMVMKDATVDYDNKGGRYYVARKKSPPRKIFDVDEAAGWLFNNADFTFRYPTGWVFDPGGLLVTKGVSEYGNLDARGQRRQRLKGSGGEITVYTKAPSSATGTKP